MSEKSQKPHQSQKGLLKTLICEEKLNEGKGQQREGCNDIVRNRETLNYCHKSFAKLSSTQQQLFHKSQKITEMIMFCHNCNDVTSLTKDNYKNENSQKTLM